MKGCEFCNDFPVHMLPRCHPTAPLRAELFDDGTLILFCYLPHCNREVVRLRVTEIIR